jgi:methionyl-tRNA synthetase
MSEVAFGNDGDFSDNNMILKVNANLANELGNLCQRTLSMVFKNCDKVVPEPGPFTPEDEKLLESAQSLRERCSAAISEQAIMKYVQAVVGMVWEANKYIDNMAPWALKKTDTARMGTVLYVILEVLRYVSILYQPLIPDSANNILDQLTVPAHERTFLHLNDDHRVKPGSPISKPKVVFPRLELPEPELVET